MAKKQTKQPHRRLKRLQFLFFPYSESTTNYLLAGMETSPMPINAKRSSRMLLFWGVLLVVAALWGGARFLPKVRYVQQQCIISTSVDSVYPPVGNIRRWASWFPNAANAKTGDTLKGAGARILFENGGQIYFEGVLPYQTISFVWHRPWPNGLCRGEIAFEQQTNATRVVWADSCTAGNSWLAYVDLVNPQAHEQEVAATLHALQSYCISQAAIKKVEKSKVKKQN